MTILQALREIRWFVIIPTLIVLASMIRVSLRKQPDKPTELYWF